MSLFRRFFYKKPPEHLVEISERVYVFDCCFSSDVMGEDEYKMYLGGGIAAQLQDHFPDSSFMVFNFREGEQRSQISEVLSQYDMTVMDYPNHYVNCPLLPLERIHYFLRSSQQNVLLMHCERSCWPVLDFMLSALLLYRKQYSGEQKTLEMVYKQASIELLRLSSPLNPQPSQLRYLQYISEINLGSDWPPSDTPLLLDCLILRDLPHFEGKNGCRPILRVYGQDPNARANRSSVLLFATPKTKTHTHLYRQEECVLVKLDIQRYVQGDVVLECMHLHDDLVREEMVFRIMFHTAFVRANHLIVHHDEMDILWDAKDYFSKEFKAEVLFSGADSMVTTTTITEDENHADITSAQEFYEVEDNFVGRAAWVPPLPPPPHPPFSHGAPPPPPPPPLPLMRGRASPPPPIIGRRFGHHRLMLEGHVKKFRPIDHRRANNTEIMLMKVKMPLPDMMAAVLAMDESVLDVDQIENLIRFFPTKEEMELLKNYTGDKAILGKCEQYFLELMKVPRAESKLRVFSFKIQFGTEITEFKKSLDAVNSACKEIRTSQKLKEIMKYILYLGNTLNRRTARGGAVGFKLESLLKLSDTRATTNSKMTLVHYLCKVLASKAPALLDFHKDLESLESASKIKLRWVAEEMQYIIKGFEKVNQELTASQSDGSVSDVFRKTLKDFISVAKTEVAAVSTLFSVVGNNADSLVYYFGEDPIRCTFEQVIATLLNFIRLFKKAHKENSKQAELEKKKSAKEVEMEKAKGVLHSSSPSPPYNSQTSQQPLAPPPPPPPPFAYVRRNSETMLTLSPRKSVYASTFEASVACAITSSSPPPPPPPPPPPRCSSSNTTKENGGHIPLPAFRVIRSISQLPSPPPPPPPSIGAPPPPPPPTFGKTSRLPPPMYGVPPPPPPSLPPFSHVCSVPSPPPPPPSHLPPPPPPPPPFGKTSRLPPPMYGVPPPPPPPPPPGGRASGPSPHPRPRPPGGGPPRTREPTLVCCFRPSFPLPCFLKPLHWVKITMALHGSLWDELQRDGEAQTVLELDESEIETLFSATVPKLVDESSGRREWVLVKPAKVHLINARRANNLGTMLTKVKTPLPDIMAAVLAMDESVLDVDQIENLVRFCPTKEEIELVKNYTGDKAILGDCEQYFLELTKAPRAEAKLRVFSFKIQFGTQMTEIKRRLNAVNSACEEVLTSQKLKEIMIKVMYLGNTLNKGTAKDAAVGFKLDSLLKLNDTRAANGKMTLMNYLCKALASKASVLLDFHKDLESLESASKVRLNSLANDMQAIIKGLEKVNQELTASESDGPVSDVFRKTLKDFITVAETEVEAVMSLFFAVGNNADALVHYFGEDPQRCSFEQVTWTLLIFIRRFKEAQEENIKQAELEECFSNVIDGRDLDCLSVVHSLQAAASLPPPPPPLPAYYSRGALLPLSRWRSSRSTSTSASST